MATDKQLIEQINRGRSKAYEQLFRRYYQQINSVCFSILKNRQDAEEAASDTFVLAYLKLDQLKKPKNFFPWLKKIAQNRSRDILRSKREKEIPLALVIGQPSRQANPDESLLRQELIDAIMKAVEALSPKDREVVRAHIEGLNHSEISERYGISAQASMNRLHRARKKIAVHLKELLNAIFGLPKMLAFKTIISGGILTMKIGTTTKVTIGVIGVLAAGFTGFQIATHQPDVEPPEVATQQQTARSQVMNKSSIAIHPKKTMVQKASDKQFVGTEPGMNDKALFASTEAEHTVPSDTNLIVSEEESSIVTEEESQESSKKSKETVKILGKYTLEEARRIAADMRVDLRTSLIRCIDILNEIEEGAAIAGRLPEQERKEAFAYLRELGLETVRLRLHVLSTAGDYIVLSGDKSSIQPGGWLAELMGKVRIGGEFIEHKPLPTAP